MSQHDRLAAEALDLVVGGFVAELARGGVRHVCVCPGSRSTPLAIKLAQQPGIKLWMHLDERSASFFGLGLARALREPVALLATSGTAAANFLPAIVEASLGRVPLVVLTADRPHELRDVGAAQTIDQLRLYGGHVKWFFDLPEPDPSPEQERLVGMLAARAVETAAAEPPGPVHLNWPFREPLIPVPRAHAATGAPDRGAEPAVRVRSGRLAPEPGLVDALAATLVGTPRGLIVCGPQDDPDLAEAVTSLAERTGYPILADGLSGLRCGPQRTDNVIDTYDAFLRDSSTVERLAPDVVLRLGAVPTSKPLLQYLQRYPGIRHIVVDPGGWREPTALASDVLHVEPRLLCASLARALEPETSSAWLAQWTALNARARAALDRHLAQHEELFEGRVFSELQQLLPAGSVLFAGNSMPVRDLDTFISASSRPLRCLSNRGANGIDGVVSTALGASAAALGTTVLVIGDVSFYHDLNGLLAARKHDLDLLVVLLNNDGGGIFSFLPQAQTGSLGEQFELLFGTPHGLDFRPFVEGYGGRFCRAENWSMFSASVAQGLQLGGLHVVEVPTERARNVAQHRAVWHAVAEAVAPVAAG